MPPLKLCLCVSHGCRKAYEANGVGHTLPSRVHRKHMDDDRLAELTHQLATAQLEPHNQLHDSLEDVQRQAVHSQEANAALSLNSGQSYPPDLVNNSRAQKILEQIEGIDARLTRIDGNINSLGQPATSAPVPGHDAKSALETLKAIEQSLHVESDKLKLIREGCVGDEGLLVVHRGVRGRMGNLLERTGEYQVVWKEALDAATLLQERRTALETSYDTGHHFNSTFRKSKPLVQISVLMVVACSVVLNLPRRGSIWLFDLARLIIQTTVLKALSLVNDLVASIFGAQSFLPSIESLPYFQSILSDFPRNIRTATAQFNLDAKKTIYATCLKCHEIYPPTFHDSLPVYPKACSHKKYGQSACKGVLVRKKKVDGQTVYTPIKPYIAYDFKDWLAGLLSRQGHEEMMDSAWDQANSDSPDGLLSDIFQGSIIRNFKGPDGTSHFSVSGGKDAGRYVFALSVDFFNPLGNKTAGKKISIGAITVSCLNLPISVRNKPENIFLAGIIPGPKEPSNSQINPYLRPLVDAFLELWKGVKFSRTSKYDLGRLVLAALVAIICDLPAARKVGGFSSHSHRYFCSICWCNRTNHTYNDISIDSWTRRTNEECREHAEAWRSASSKGAAQRLFDTSGLRWSELLRLPYYEPAKFLVIDPMHNLFLGLIKEHFQGILGYVPPRQQRGPSDPWAKSFQIHISQSPFNPLPIGAKEQSSIRKLISWLETPLESDRSDHTASERIVKRWSSVHLASLIYVAKGVSCVSLTVDAKGKDTSLPNPTKPLTKVQVAERLLDWRLQRAEVIDNLSSSESSNNPPPLQHGSVFTTKEMEALWKDIESLVKPSWVQTPPSTLGTPSCGKLKSDQWRIIGSLYLPVTLIRLWENPVSEGARLRRRRELLQLTMHLLSAIVVASSQVTSPQHAEAYLSHMIEYRKQLKTLFPDYECHPNHHIALHISEYLLMYGPVHGWWAYPYEHVIGMLQRFSTNYKEGEYEETISRSWHRLTNLRAFFSKVTCPQPILACYDMFKLLVPSYIRNPLDAQDSHSDLDGDDDDISSNAARKQVALSGSIRSAFQVALGPDVTIPSHAMFSNQATSNNQFFTSSRRHKGNSGVFRKHSTIPFCIDHIVEFSDAALSRSDRLRGKWVVGRSMKPISLQHDPYSDFPHLRAKLWGTDLASSVEVCRLDRIESHFAQHCVTWEGKDTTVVISLSRKLILS